jgi:hypothetical protein
MRSRTRSLSPQAVTPATPARATNRACRPAQAQGFARAAAVSKTALGSIVPITPWWMSTNATATKNGTQSS